MQLKQLHRRYRIRRLWIDAICIEQTAEGEPERNEQVKNMGEVYASASIVLIWLGTEILPHTTTTDLLVLSAALMMDTLRMFCIMFCVSHCSNIVTPKPFDLVSCMFCTRPNVDTAL